MPIKLEHIHQPTPEDWNDLDKLHQNSGLAPLSRDQLDNLLTSNGWIAGGRFNDRIVGVILCSQSADIVTLHCAAVRTLTQRRGVMHQSLWLLQKWAANEGFVLQINNLPEFLHAAVVSRGFTETAEGTWQWTPTN